MCVFMSNVTGFKIEGINNSSVIWFFSIQGLFQVAFDLGNMAFQKDCLSQLQVRMCDVNLFLPSFSESHPDAFHRGASVKLVHIVVLCKILIAL